uniref:Complex III subunit 9 n=1 Tax=Ficedula albicollis TaxID=59894 RepID=U3JX06_FICAL
NNSPMVNSFSMYSSLFRRTSTFALSVVLGAVLFERAFDQGADALFEYLNEGVRAKLPKTS